MRKQITLTPTNQDFVFRLSRHLKLSQSAVINYGIYLLACSFGELSVDLFKQRINHYYQVHYIKVLPRGKKSKIKEDKYEKEKMET